MTNGIFTIHIVFSCSVIHNLHLFEWPSELDGGFDCRLTKSDGILQGMLCYWPETKFFNGFLGQIQINTKLKIDDHFDAATHRLRSPHPVNLAITTVVVEILDAALRNPRNFHPYYDQL